MKYVNYDNLETAKEMIKVALEKKVDKEDGKGLSTNDYTNEEKIKLAGIEEEANKTIVDSELSLESTNPVENKIVKEALDTKADKIAVEEALETKADKIAVEEALNTKADKIAVEEALETKADKQEVAEALDTKVDKETGKGLSTNDFTNEEKEKLSKLDIKSNENIIEVIKQNGEVLEIQDKSVNIVTITEDTIDNKIEEAVKNVEVDLTDYAKRSDIPKNVSDLFNDKAFIASSDEKDPTVPAHVKAITEEDIEKWNSGTGSGSGSESCNVVVDAVEPSNGEAIWIKLAKNLCHFNNVKNEYSINSSGKVISDYMWSKWLTTDFIEVEPNTKYTLSGIRYGSSSRYHAWYDSNKNPISAFPRYVPAGQNDSQTVTSPSNAKYIRFSIYNGYKVTEQDERLYFQFEKGSTATSYAPYSGKSDMFVKNSNGEYEQIYEAFPVPSPEIKEYVLPAATKDTLGGIKVGDNLTVDADGTLHAQAGGGNSSGEAIVVEGSDVIYEGVLKGGDSVVLSNVKRFLDIYFVIYLTNHRMIGKYTIDTSLPEPNYGSTVMMASDGEPLTYYVSESKFEKSTNTLSHLRTGYFSVSTQNYTDRTARETYYVYRVDTYDNPNVIAGGSGGDIDLSDIASVKNDIITLSNTEDLNISVTGEYQYFKLKTISQTGNSFSVEDGNLKIGKDVSRVKISFTSSLSWVDTTGTKYVRVERDNEALAMSKKTIDSGKLDIITMSPVIVDVNEGDILKLGAYGAVGDYYYRGQTYLTIEKVNEMSVLSTEQNNGTYMWIHNSEKLTLEPSTAAKLSFDKIIQDTSNGKLIHEDGGIRIGKGVKQVLIISKWNSWTTTCQKYIYVRKNGVGHESAGFPKEAWTANVVSYMDVTEGDYIEIYGYQSDTATMSISSNVEQTGLKVIVLGETTNVEVNGDITSGNSNIVGEENSMIKVDLSANYSHTLSGAWSRQAIPFDKISSQIGNGFTLTPEGRIKIGSGISKISINAAALICRTSVLGTVDLCLRLYRDNEPSTISLAYHYISSLKDYQTINNIVPIFDVQENDEIEMNFTSDVVDTFQLSSFGTFISIEKIHDTNVIACEGEPPSMLTASLPAPVEITATDTAQRITSFVELTKIGDKFSVENGVIRIGKGVSKIKLAYNAVAQATVSTTRTFTYIMLNDAAKSQESYYFSDKIYQVGNAIPSMLLDVKEGDEITLMMYGYAGNKILGATTFTYWTQITVEEVKETNLIAGGSTEEDSGWLDGKTVTGDWANFRYRKIGKRVRFEGRAGSLTPSMSEILLGTIPVEYAPMKTIFTIGYGAGTQLARFNINNAGEVKITYAWDILTAKQVTATTWYHFYFDYWLD